MQYIKSLVAGYKQFINKEVKDGQYRYGELAAGQSPKVMVISCSDSRVVPAQIFNKKPGELFMVRNIANLVPPFETDDAHHGTSSALEYAVFGLDVEHIIVMGHSSCGGIGACLDLKKNKDAKRFFINKWLSMLAETAARVLSDPKYTSDAEKRRALELGAIKTSLANLETFPFIAERLENKTLEIHGAHFDIEDGQLYALNKESGEFSPVLSEDQRVA